MQPVLLGLSVMMVAESVVATVGAAARTLAHTTVYSVYVMVMEVQVSCVVRRAVRLLISAEHAVEDQQLVRYATLFLVTYQPMTVGHHNLQSIFGKRTGTYHADNMKWYVGSIALPLCLCLGPSLNSLHFILQAPTGSDAISADSGLDDGAQGGKKAAMTVAEISGVFFNLICHFSQYFAFLGGTKFAYLQQIGSSQPNDVCSLSCFKTLS
jgi:hypothetical protein